MRPNAYPIIVAVIVTIGLSTVLGQSTPKPKTKSNRSSVKPAQQSTAPVPVPTPPPTPVKCETNGLTAAEITELAEGHNKVRTPLGLMPLVWDCALANLAQDWANRSQFEHRDTPLGENIFVSADPSEPISTVISRWMSEKPNWDNAAGVCAAGKVCTHYTQMVWRSTAKFGCGINRRAAGKWKAMLVCNYDPSSRQSGPAY